MTIKSIWLLEDDHGKPIKTLRELVNIINLKLLEEWKEVTDIHYLITKEGGYAAIAHF